MTAAPSFGIYHRLLVASGFLICTLAALGGLATICISQVSRDANAIAHDWMASVNVLSDLAVSVAEFRLLQADALTGTMSPSLTPSAQLSVRQNSVQSRMETALKNYEFLAILGEEQHFAAEITDRLQNYLSKSAQISGLLQEDPGKAVLYFYTNLGTDYAELCLTIAAATEFSRRGGLLNDNAVQAAGRRASAVIVVSTLVAGVLIYAIIFWLHRHVFRRIVQLSHAMLKLGRRDYSFDLPSVIHNDEIGYMVTAIKICRLALQAADALALASAEEQAQAYARLITLSNADPLTGLANRRRFDQALQRAWEEAAAAKQWLGLLMIDIDQFKLVNDTFGHSQGDVCLQAVAGAIHSACRQDYDLVTRYGGDEFMVLMRGTDPDMAQAAGERVRNAVAGLGLLQAPGSVRATVAVSVGIVAVVPGRDVVSADIAVRQADSALYAAKTLGRDRVLLANKTEAARFCRAERLSENAFGTKVERPRSDAIPTGCRDQVGAA